MLCKRLEKWLVLFDDFFCDTTQLVNINKTTVNLPFSLFSISVFQYIICLFRLLAVFNSNFKMAYLHVVYDPFRLISTWFALISYRISRNCFFFFNILPHFGNRPWLEFPFISRNLHWTLNWSKALLKCLEQIAKSPPKYRAVFFSTGLLCKEAPVLRSAILLQPCTSFSRHLLTLHSLITGKNRQETCDFSRSYLWCQGVSLRVWRH